MPGRFIQVRQIHVPGTESRSEIVLPSIRNGELLGVLDIDSPKPDRFGPEDEVMLMQLTGLFVRSLDA